MLLGTQLHPRVKGIADVDWKKVQKSLTYVSSTSFKVAGDQTAIFQIARAIRIDGITGYVLEITVASEETTVLVSCDFGESIDLVEIGHDANSSPARVIIMDHDPLAEDDEYPVGISWYNNVGRKFFTCVHIFTEEGTAAWKCEDGSFIGATTETPTLSCGTQGFEGLHHEVLITNYDVAKSYNISVTGGETSRIENTITWVLPQIPSEIPVDHIITVKATALNKEESEGGNATVEILELNIVDDQAVVLEGETFLRTNFDEPGDMMPTYGEWSGLTYSSIDHLISYSDDVTYFTNWWAFNDDYVLFYHQGGVPTLQLLRFTSGKNYTLLQSLTKEEIWGESTHSGAYHNHIKLNDTQFALFALANIPGLTTESEWVYVIGSLADGTCSFGTPKLAPVFGDTSGLAWDIERKNLKYYENNKILLVSYHQFTNVSVVLMDFDPITENFSFNTPHNISDVSNCWHISRSVSEIKNSICLLNLAVQISGTNEYFLLAIKIDGSDIILGPQYATSNITLDVTNISDIDTAYNVTSMVYVTSQFDNNTAIAAIRGRNTSATLLGFLCKLVIDPTTLAITTSYGVWYQRYIGDTFRDLIPNDDSCIRVIGENIVAFLLESIDYLYLTIWKDTGSAIELITPTNIINFPDNAPPETMAYTNGRLVVSDAFSHIFKVLPPIQNDNQFLLTSDTLKDGSTILFEQEAEDTDWQRYQNTTKEEYIPYTLETGTAVTVLKLKGISNVLTVADIVILEDGTQVTLNNVTEVPLGSDESMYTCGIDELAETPSGTVYFGVTTLCTSIGKNDEYQGDEFACALYSSDTTIIQCVLDFNNAWLSTGYNKSVKITVAGVDIVVETLSITVADLGTTWRYTLEIPTQSEAPSAMWKPSTFRENIIDTLTVVAGKIHKAYLEHYFVNEGVRQIKHRWAAVQTGIELHAIQNNLTKEGS